MHQSWNIKMTNHLREQFHPLLHTRLSQEMPARQAHSTLCRAVWRALKEILCLPIQLAKWLTPPWLHTMAKIAVLVIILIAVASVAHVSVTKGALLMSEARNWRDTFANQTKAEGILSALQTQVYQPLHNLTKASVEAARSAPARLMTTLTNLKVSTEQKMSRVWGAIQMLDDLQHPTAAIMRELQETLADMSKLTNLTMEMLAESTKLQHKLAWP